MSLVSGVVQTTPELAPRHRRFRSDSGRPSGLAIVFGVVVTVAGVALRFYCPSALWLDETISVNISRLPVAQIPAALHMDGAPPLYYVLLHYWMLGFGQGDTAVRALSGVISVISLPLFWFAGKRIGGRSVGWTTYFLAVSSPFLIEYATTTRMYALMVLCTLLGYLAIARALEQPTWRRLSLLGLVTASVLYTHYWGLYLIGMTGLWLIYHIWRSRRGLPTRLDPTALRRCLGAMVLGSLLFAPWAPTFVFQSFHTGTPWTSAAGPADVLGIFQDFAGTGPWAVLLAFLYFALLLLGVFGRRIIGRDGGPAPQGTGDERTGFVSARTSDEEQLLAAELDAAAHRGRLRSAARRGLDRLVGFAGFGPGGSAGGGSSQQPNTFVLQLNARTLPLFGIMAGTLLVAMLAGAVVQAAFVARYASVVLPLFLLIVAVGISVFGQRRIVGATVALMCVAGLLTGYGNNGQPRTQAVQVASVLNAQAKPGDLVLYCPDQLGPAVDRLLAVPGVTELTFPRAIGPERVDWINYLSTIDHTNVETFAQDALTHVGADNTVWLVWNRSYHGLGQDCGELSTWLSYFQGNGTTLITANPSYYENEMLTRYPSSSASA